MKVSYLANVSGRVQGVYFRMSAQQQAIDHQLSGYAKNLDDGSVEVLMCGEEQQVKDMIEWLQHGSEESEVSNVDAKQVEWQSVPFFSIG
ncbi:acylphosphatase [Thalassotalea agarivorans]|uniref:Acylphosphatase n=1 Tax=Thalassotalea agarivorans TaxID=349064 RepID=A0A1I0D7R6_THASX|nr:acylphosphatase [Thalassotalea agarivorans]SET28306.1 acylphosphatase [Thalassotalea agarivorans]